LGGMNRRINSLYSPGLPAKKAASAIIRKKLPIDPAAEAMYPKELVKIRSVLVDRLESISSKGIRDIKAGNRTSSLLNNNCAVFIKEGRSCNKLCDWLINGTAIAIKGMKRNSNNPRMPNTNATPLGSLNLISNVSVMDRINKERIKARKIIIRTSRIQYKIMTVIKKTRMIKII